ncbi:hypothetical protein STENM223S_01182 [Streptomyces tendae]
MGRFVGEGLGRLPLVAVRGMGHVLRGMWGVLGGARSGDRRGLGRRQGETAGARQGGLLGRGVRRSGGGAGRGAVPWVGRGRAPDGVRHGLAAALDDALPCCPARAPALAHRTSRPRGEPGGSLLRAVLGEPGRERAELVEDLDQLVVRAGLRQQLRRRGERLARPRRCAETRLRIGLEQGGHHLPQRLGDALRRTRRPVVGEILDEGLGVRLRALEQIQGDQAHGEEVGGEVRFGAHHLLRGQISGGADDQVGLGQPGFAQPHGDAEVRQPQLRPAPAGGLQQHVGGLDVAVHHVLRVHGRES